MADAPWRCSQCGTVNEPVANACRTCGRWPSLFELEGSTLDSGAPAPGAYDEAVEHAAETVDVEYAEPEPYVGDVAETELEHEAPDEEYEPPKPLWQRLASFVIPIGFVLYILISALANRDAG